MTRSIAPWVNREVVTVDRFDRVVEAAREMRSHHVGDVVVVDTEGGQRKPVGILTDRDIVLLGVAKDPSRIEQMLVAELMSAGLLSVAPDAPIPEVVAKMCRTGVRRLPVIENNTLVGIVTLDDLLRLLSADLAALADLASSQRKIERMGA